MMRAGSYDEGRMAGSDGPVCQGYERDEGRIL